MTPHRDAGQGSFLLDRRLGKLGRYKAASGTRDHEEFAALNGMLTKLKRDRRWDLLGLLVQRVISPLELYDAFYRGTLHQLPTADELRALRPAVEQWLPRADLASTTRDEYERALLARIPDGAKAAALPGILRDAADAARTSGKRPAFNRLLMAARSFAAATFGDEHKLTKAVRAIATFDESPRPGNPQEPDQIRTLCQHFRFAAEVWSLCLTGMRRLEYFPERWTVGADRIRIDGVKGRGGVPLPRVVPLIYRPTAPTVGYSGFYHALVEASGQTLTVHDLRKTWEVWLEEAGVADWRIELYAGHARGRKNLATIYRKPRDLTRLLVEDADRVRQWLGDPPASGLRAVSA